MASAFSTLAASWPNAYTTIFVSTNAVTDVELVPVDPASVVPAAITTEQCEINGAMCGKYARAAFSHVLGETKNFCRLLIGQLFHHFIDFLGDPHTALRKNSCIGRHSLPALGDAFTTSAKSIEAAD
jgi:hypothetical protein